MRAVGDAQESFRAGAAGAQLTPEMSQLATNAYIADNQKLSGLAGNDLPHWLTSRGITTVFITGVAHEPDLRADRPPRNRPRIHGLRDQRLRGRSGRGDPMRLRSPTSS